MANEARCSGKYVVGTAITFCRPRILVQPENRFLARFIAHYIAPPGIFRLLRNSLWCRFLADLVAEAMCCCCPTAGRSINKTTLLVGVDYNPHNSSPVRSGVLL